MKGSCHRFGASWQSKCLLYGSLWLILLCLSLHLTSQSVSATTTANVTFDHTNTADDRATLAALVRGNQVGPVTAWVKIGYLIRNAYFIDLSQIPTYYSQFTSGNYKDPALAIAPAFVALLLSLLCCVFLFICCPIIDCCCICNTCHCCWKEDREFGPKDKRNAKIAIAFAILLAALCCAGGIGTVFLEQTALRNTQASPYSALADTNGLLTGASAEINAIESQALNLIGLSAVQAVQFSSVPAFKTNLFNNLTILLNDVLTITNQAKGLMTPATAVQSDITSLSNALSTVNTNLTMILTDLKHLWANHTYVGPPTWVYRITTDKSGDIPNPSDVLTLDSSIFPNVTQLVSSSLANINLDSIAGNITSQVTSLMDSVNRVYNNITGQVQGYVQPLVQPTVDSIQTSVAPIVNSTSVTITGLQSSFVSYADMPDQYWTMIFWGQIGISILPLFIILLLTLCVATKSPRMVTCCLVFVPLLASLFFLLAIIFYLVTTVVDVACREAFERSMLDVPPSLVNVTSMLASIPSPSPLTVDMLVNSLRRCSAGVDTLSVASTLGFNTTQYSLPTLLGTQFDKLNLTQMVVDLNLPSLINSIGVNGSYISSMVSNLNLSAAISFVNVTSIASALNSSTTSINTLYKNMTDMNTQVGGLSGASNSAAWDSFFTYYPGPTLDQTVRDDTVSDLQSLITANQSHISAFNSSSPFTLLQTAPSLITADINLMNTTVLALLSNVTGAGNFTDVVLNAARLYANGIPTEVATLLVPYVRALLMGNANTVQSSLLNYASCAIPANGILGTRGAVCVQMLYALDGLWMLFFWAAVTFTFSLWWFTCANRRLAMINWEEDNVGDDVNPLLASPDAGKGGKKGGKKDVDYIGHPIYDADEESRYRSMISKVGATQNSINANNNNGQIMKSRRMSSSTAGGSQITPVGANVSNPQLGKRGSILRRPSLLSMDQQPLLADQAKQRLSLSPSPVRSDAGEMLEVTPEVVHASGGKRHTDEIKQLMAEERELYPRRTFANIDEEENELLGQLQHLGGNNASRHTLPGEVSLLQSMPRGGDRLSSILDSRSIAESSLRHAPHLPDPHQLQGGGTPEAHYLTVNSTTTNQQNVTTNQYNVQNTIQNTNVSNVQQNIVQPILPMVFEQPNETPRRVGESFTAGTFLSDASSAMTEQPSNPAYYPTAPNMSPAPLYSPSSPLPHYQPTPFVTGPNRFLPQGSRPVSSYYQTEGANQRSSPVNEPAAPLPHESYDLQSQWPKDQQ